MLKLSENPPILAPTANSVRDLSGKWWVGHTKARFEKAFARNLLERGIGYFLPMTESTRISGGKKRKVILPLFSSYVFFCGSQQDRYSAMTTNCLCQTIEVADQENLIAELTGIEKAINGNFELASYPINPPGSRCRITGGALKGLEGIVIEHARRKTRLVLEVSILGQGALIEIDADLLEPV